MPDASATRGFGLAGKIFLASALLVVAVLGITFGITSLQANRTADASIQRALTAARTAVEDFLAAVRAIYASTMSERALSWPPTMVK